MKRFGASMLAEHLSRRSQQSNESVAAQQSGAVLQGSGRLCIRLAATAAGRTAPSPAPGLQGSTAALCLAEAILENGYYQGVGVQPSLGHCALLSAVSFLAL
jgi:hypothetical protein